MCCDAASPSDNLVSYSIILTAVALWQAMFLVLTIYQQTQLWTDTSHTHCCSKWKPGSKSCHLNHFEAVKLTETNANTISFAATQASQKFTAIQRWTGLKLSASSTHMCCLVFIIKNNHLGLIHSTGHYVVVDVVTLFTIHTADNILWITGTNKFLFYWLFGCFKIVFIRMNATGIQELTKILSSRDLGGIHCS